MSVIDSYLKSCGELTRFCSLNGWIDNGSLRYTVMLETTSEIIIEVEFEELLLEASGRIGGRVSCSGQLHLYLDNRGHIIRADIL